MIRLIFPCILIVVPTAVLWAKPIPQDQELVYQTLSGSDSYIEISRTEYAERLRGFWLAQCIANWTGLRTEAQRRVAPFFTDEDWDQPSARNWRKDPPEPVMIEYVLVPDGEVWGADDDTDIEYIYQSLMDEHNVSVLKPNHIREGWLKHIKHEEENYLWVSNERALNLMIEGFAPPATSLPINNPDYDKIDAQLTTEIFGLFAPGRPDIALKLAHLPIRTTAYRDSEWIAEFYVIMHSLAAVVDENLSQKEQVFWLAEQARKRLPDESYPAKMYDRIFQEYKDNPDKDDWESSRDALYRRHTGQTVDGYNYRSWYGAGINFGASLVSLFYGEGDLKRTIRIGSLCGWDSDNPTATWAGLLGFMLGGDGVQAEFLEVKLSNEYWIGRTRVGFPDRTPGLEGDDTFTLMAERGVHVLDRVVLEEMGGGVDLEAGVLQIPFMQGEIVRAEY